MSTHADAIKAALGLPVPYVDFGITTVADAVVNYRFNREQGRVEMRSVNSNDPWIDSIHNEPIYRVVHKNDVIDPDAKQRWWVYERLKEHGLLGELRSER